MPFDPVASNIARIALVQSGIPVETPGITVSCTCGSAMQAVAFGVRAIQMGDADTVIAGGVESMSNTPYICDAVRWGQRLRHAEMSDLIWKQMQEYPLGGGMGLTAENIAERDGITREEHDELALTSQQRATAIGDDKLNISPSADRVEFCYRPPGAHTAEFCPKKTSRKSVQSDRSG